MENIFKDFKLHTYEKHCLSSRGRLQTKYKFEQFQNNCPTYKKQPFLIRV